MNENRTFVLPTVAGPCTFTDGSGLEYEIQRALLPTSVSHRHSSDMENYCGITWSCSVGSTCFTKECYYAKGRKR